MGTNTRQVPRLTRLFVMLQESLLSNFHVWINQSGCWRAGEKLPLNLVMRNSPSLLLVTGPWSWHPAMAGSRWWGAPCNTVITDQPLLPWCYALWSQTHGRGETAEREGPPRGPVLQQLNIHCVQTRQTGGFRGRGRRLSVRRERGVSELPDIIRIMQQSAVCCSHSQCSDMTTLRTVGTREIKFSFFRHFYKINLLFRCIWMKLVTHCLYFVKLSRSCCWKLEHNLDEPSLT